MRGKVVKGIHIVRLGVTIALSMYVWVATIFYVGMLLSQYVFKSPLSQISNTDLVQIFYRIIYNSVFYVLYIIGDLVIIYTKEIKVENKFKYLKSFSFIYLIIYGIIMIIM